jgi:hypothetical protein
VTKADECIGPQENVFDFKLQRRNIYITPPLNIYECGMAGLGRFAIKEVMGHGGPQVMSD